MIPFRIGPGSIRYSSIRASNGKWIAIQVDAGFNALYRFDGTYVRVLPAMLSHSAQVVFDRHDQNLLLYVAGNALMMYDVAANISDTLHVFTEYDSLAANHAEGDLSETSHLALCGLVDEHEEVFLFDARRGIKGSIYREPGSFDGIKAAGDHLLLSKASGIYDLTAGADLTAANGHAACNSEYLAWCSNARRERWRNAVELVSLSDPAVEIALMDFGKQNYAMHLSIGRDSVFVSAYDPDGNLPNQIWQAPFDTGIPPTLLHEWRAAYRGYESTPRATYGDDGLLLWNVDDGQAVSVWGLRLESSAVSLDAKTSEIPPGFSLVAMENEPDADYMMILPVRGGKALPWQMFKRNL